MKRKAIFLTKTELQALQQMVRYCDEHIDGVFPSSLVDHLPSSPQEGDLGIKPGMYAKLHRKLDEAPTIPADQLGNLDHALANSIEADCDAKQLLGSMNRVRATRRAWENICKAFYACTSSVSITGKL